MTDVAIGFLLLGVAMLVVLGIVFAISSRGGAPRETPHPPRGVHLPGPSFLPVIMSVGALLLGAGLAVLVFGIVSWVAAANSEWRDTEHGSHDDGAAH